MRRSLLLIAILCVAGGLYLSFRSPRGPVAELSSTTVLATNLTEPRSRVKNPVSEESTAESASPTASSLPDAAALSSASQVATPSSVPLSGLASDLEPSTVLQNMRSAIRDYGSMFGGNPVGTNPEITRALDGENPKQAKFLRPDAGLTINSKGELVDSWGTPFFFHQLSGNEMEIRSAGPDRKMWTRDDLVTR